MLRDHDTTYCGQPFCDMSMEALDILVKHTNTVLTWRLPKSVEGKRLALGLFVVLALGQVYPLVDPHQLLVRSNLS